VAATTYYCLLLLLLLVLLLVDRKWPFLAQALGTHPPLRNINEIAYDFFKEAKTPLLGISMK